MKQRIWLAAALLVGCGGDDTSGDADAAPGITPDTAEDTTSDADTTVDAVADADAPAECTDGETTCADDGLSTLTCEAGQWVDGQPCWDGRLVCDAGACVATWQRGAPTWSTCPDEPRATPSSLAGKAAYFDEIAARLHVHPELKWLAPVLLRQEEVPCEGGEEGPCFAPVDPDTATWEDVERFHSGANDGLWNGLYLTSQAYRYAVTGDPEALDMIRVLMEGQRQRFAIAGVPGIFVRALRPDTDYMPCPTDPMDYVPDVEKDDDKWVRIDDEGCIATYDVEAEEFVSTDHCGMQEFAGWCFLDNVSQDEYAGHMLALAAVWRFVDDEAVRELVVEMMSQVGSHLVDNDLTFIDWDGRATEHGILHATSLVDSPGFLAAQVLAWVNLAAKVTGREDLDEFYRECLLQENDMGRCLPHGLERGEPYHTTYLPQMALYIGVDACQSNFNRLSMVMANLWVLLEYEDDWERRGIVQDVLRNNVMYDESLRSISIQRNTWFNFIYASAQDLNDDNREEVAQLVEDGICSLRQFPERKVQFESTLEDYERYCAARLGEDATETPIAVADRCASTFLWWGSPFSIRPCGANDANVIGPADYLLAYWMGRYYGFVTEDM